MIERERLIELLKSPNKAAQLRKNGVSVSQYEADCPEAVVADFLLDNGVIVPPCKVGDTVWLLYTDGFIEELEVDGIAIGKNCDTIAFTNGSCFTVWGKDYNYYFKWVFPTKEEAEKALAEREQK